MSQLLNSLPDILDEYISRRKKGPKPAFQDEYTRYCLLDTVPKLLAGYLKWWSIHEAEFPRLARLARDIFGIPGMSAEVERLFSSAKLMIPPHRSSLKPASIEAGEFIRSWVKGGLFYSDYFEYLSHEERKRSIGKSRHHPPLGSAIFRNISSGGPGRLVQCEI
jgi:hypothetical protein